MCPISAGCRSKLAGGAAPGRLSTQVERCVPGALARGDGGELLDILAKHVAACGGVYKRKGVKHMAT